MAYDSRSNLPNHFDLPETSDKSALNRELHIALSDAGLLPSATNYRKCWNNVYQLGNQCKEQLLRKIDTGLWEKALRSDQNGISDKDIIRILGFGAFLTRFITAPLDIKKPDIDDVVFLGSLVNFIVTYFDHLIDNGYPATGILPVVKPKPSGLLELPAKFISTISMPPHTKLLRCCVSHFYKLLLRFPHHRSRPRIVQFIEHMIQTMYLSELETVKAGHAPASTVMIRRKSALPFVVMGITGWLAADKVDERVLHQHLLWLYRLGVYFGNIDDVIDLESDRLNEHPNEIASRLNSADDKHRLLNSIPTLIARSGSRIIESWQAHVPEQIKQDPLMRNALGVVTCSWLGGITQ